MKTGAILAVTVQGADLGDTTTIDDRGGPQMELPESKLPDVRNRGR